jgi:hypothetical protein
LRQAVGFAQPIGQRDAADFTGDAIVFPPGAGNVTADDALDRQRLRFADDHGAAGELVVELIERRGEIRGAEDVVGNDVFQEFEPEKRELREDAALVGNGRGKDDVEGGEAVGGDDQELVAEIIDVTDFSARGGSEAGELRFANNFHGRSR